MRAGPKMAVDESVLPWRPRATGSARFAAFCDKYMRVPKRRSIRSTGFTRRLERNQLWRASELVVVGKGSRQDRLPLPDGRLTH